VLVQSDGMCKGAGFVTFQTVEQATLAKAIAMERGGILFHGNPSTRVEVHFSESSDARQARVQRNRNNRTEKPRTSSTLGPPPYAQQVVAPPYAQQVVAPPQAYPANFLQAYSNQPSYPVASSSTAARIHRSASTAPVVMAPQNTAPIPLLIPINQAAFPANSLPTFLSEQIPPRAGDLFVAAPNLSLDRLVELFAPVSPVKHIVFLGNFNYCIRLSDSTSHVAAATSIQGFMIDRDNCLRVALVADFTQ